MLWGLCFSTGSGSVLCLCWSCFELASHLTNREQTSYDLKVIESLRNFCLKNFLYQAWKLSETISGCFQLWWVCYIRNIKIFEKLSYLFFNLKSNSVLDLILSRFVEIWEKNFVNIWILYGIEKHWKITIILLSWANKYRYWIRLIII